MAFLAISLAFISNDDGGYYAMRRRIYEVVPWRFRLEVHDPRSDHVKVRAAPGAFSRRSSDFASTPDTALVHGDTTRRAYAVDEIDNAMAV